MPQAVTLLDALAQAAEFYRTGRWAQAEQLCRSILAARADQPDALYLLGLIAARTQRTPEAERLLARAIAMRPEDLQLLANHATALKDLGRFDEALREYDLALRLRPDYVEALFNRGAALQTLGRAAEAVQSFSRVLALRPGLAAAHHCRGNALYELGHFELARQDYEQASSLRPDHVEAHNNLGATLLKLDRFEDAARSLDRALQLDPRHAAAHYNRGLALQRLRRFDDALQHHERAVALRPDYAEACLARANLLMELGQPSAAAESHDRAVSLRPGNAQAHIDRGNALQQLGRFEQASESYDRALQIEPDNGECHYHRGNALRHLFRFGEALQSYATAYRLRPQQPWLLGVWLHVRMQLCAWDGLEGHLAELISRIERGMQATSPFSLLALVDSDPLQRRAAEIWVEAEHGKESPPPALPRRPRTSRIRLGYFSADFHEHATAFLAAQLFERHDRGRFELIALSFGPDRNDAMRVRLRAAFDTFLDVRLRPDEEIARLSRELAVDIAVDLKGYTQQGALGHLRPARGAHPGELSRLPRNERRAVHGLSHRRSGAHSRREQAVLFGADRIPAQQLSAERPPQENRRHRALARSARPARSRVRVLLLQRRLQAHAADIR